MLAPVHGSTVVPVYLSRFQGMLKDCSRLGWRTKLSLGASQDLRLSRSSRIPTVRLAPERAQH